MARLLALAALVAAGAAVFFVVRTSGDDTYVTRAEVPGVGVVEGRIARDARVRPPATVPRAPRLKDKAAFRLEDDVTTAVEGVRADGERGDEDAVEAVKRAFGELLFLAGAAEACTPPPRAAYAVVAHVFTAPQRRLELDLLAETPDDSPSCVDTRLRIDSWRGVSVDGDRATVALRGAIERGAGGEWRGLRTEWRAVLRKRDGAWRVAALEETARRYED